MNTMKKKRERKIVRSYIVILVGLFFVGLVTSRLSSDRIETMRRASVQAQWNILLSKLEYKSTWSTIKTQCSQVQLFASIPKLGVF
jgi:transposase